jgi:hypothetical protein
LDLDRVRSTVDAGWKLVSDTRGYLSEREARFLMTALALSPARGANVEIGSFVGRSTVGLAHVAIELGLGQVTAIDPHTAPASTDPDLHGNATSYDEFVANLECAGVGSAINIRRAFSYDVATVWRDQSGFSGLMAITPTKARSWM